MALLFYNIPIDWAIPIIEVAITIIITFLIVRLYRTIVHRLGTTVPAGIVSSLQQIGSWAIWVVGFLVVLNQIQVNIQVLLLIVFLGGSAIIIAYRNILADLAASQFLSSYQSFKVGEWIEVQNNYGRVIERNLIQTKILTPDNEIVVIPNSTLLKRSMVNRSRSGGLRIQIPILLQKGADLANVEERLLEIGRSLKVDLASDEAPQFRVAEVNPEGAKVMLVLKINNPAKRDQIISEVEKQVYNLLPELNLPQASRE
jgi:small conductance mechanosensitive channel